MVVITIKRLNIFVDETGEFGFGKNASKVYGVSFTFHEHKNNITRQLETLNNRLERIGYTNMIHMADLISKRNEYADMDIEKRKSIFYSIFEFSKRVDIKYKTIIIDKNFTDDKQALRRKLIDEVRMMVESNIDYFNKFDSIVLYYDNGQDTLTLILESIFSMFDGFEHRIEFDHIKKRLFQVSDMLTYVDKLQYKYKNKIEFNKNEKYFFSLEDLRRIMKELNKKRF